MRIISYLLFCLALLISGTKISKAQTIELLAGNTLNGTVNGTLLGGATMALTNNSDFGPLRVGVGFGTLYGIGVGTYDVISSNGQHLLVSGMFNDGNNTSIIALLDTFYGAAAGAIVGTSIMLIAEEPIIDGLKYGSATGAWIGFGVGVIDAFILSERITPSASFSAAKSRNMANGLVGIHLNEKTSLGLLSPSLISTYQIDALNVNQKITPTVQVLNLRLNL
ncbi:MAG TPA: hypothetical protein VFM80_09770 [Gracilimonas sp.]|uniref:hypothetical protein n=1 Tax=Gracilimonas sp. TaxID=1974203 RepID=UPI002D99EE8E|nr:hypothetical protein [Gracilimonas sp.]